MMTLIDVQAHQRAASLVQQVVGLQDHGRMPAEDEVANAFGWMNEHIVFLQPEHHLTPTMEEVLRLAEAAIVRCVTSNTLLSIQHHSNHPNMFNLLIGNSQARC